MKRTVFFSCICILIVFGLVAFTLSNDGHKEIAEAPRSSLSSSSVKIEQAMSEPANQDVRKSELPDYHPDRFPIQRVTITDTIPRPDALEDTMASVESSLNNRIRTLNQNLGDRATREALRRELTGNGMSAYKEAVVWTVKNSLTIDSE